MSSHQCLHCKDTLSYIEHARSHYCEKPLCQRTKVQLYLVENKKRLSAQLIAEIEEFIHNTATHQLPTWLSHELEKAPILALLPANTNQLKDLDEERKQEFLHHLSMIYDNVEKNNPSGSRVYSESLDPPLPENEAELIGKACATCMGSCCNLGQTHAFIDYPSLKRLLVSQSLALSEQELLELYSDYFPEQSYQYSCVFLGKKGCSLPKELRSFTCNNFLCDEVLNYRRNALQTDSTLTFAAAVHNDKIMFTSVYNDEDFIRIKEK